MTKIIEIKDLKKHFGKVHAVDGVSFDIEKGESFGFCPFIFPHVAKFYNYMQHPYRKFV